MTVNAAGGYSLDSSSMTSWVEAGPEPAFDRPGSAGPRQRLGNDTIPGVRVKTAGNQKPKRGQQARSNAWQYASLGTELAASIIGLTLVGLWIDYQFKVRPIGVLVGAGVGVVGGLYNFLRAAVRMGAQQRDRSKPDNQYDGNDSTT